MRFTRRELTLGAAGASVARLVAPSEVAASPDGQGPAPALRAARQEGSPRPGGSISLADQNLPPTLDIHATTNDFLDIIGQHIYQPLVYLHPETKEPVAGLAESWEQSEDGTVWTFTLRPDVHFQDGNPLTSADVKASWDRLLNPDTLAPRASLLGGENLVSIETPDEMTVVVTHQEPMANFLANIARTFAMVVSRDLIENGNMAEQAVGTGPFQLSDYVQADHITIARWDDFNWGPEFFQHTGPPHLDDATWISIEEEGTRIAAIERGELQIGRLPWSQFQRFNEQVPGFSVTTISNPGIPAGIFLNSQLSPLDEHPVRLALAHATDRESIVQSPSYRGAVWIELGPLTEDMLGFDPASREAWPEFNLDTARSLLAEAGFVAGADGVMERDGQRLSLTFPVSALTLPIAQILQGQFGEIGVELVVSTLDQAAVTAQWDTGTEHVNGGANTGNDPDVLWDVFHTGQRGQVTDPTVDDLLERARTAVDLDERLALYSELQTYLAGQVYTIHIHNSARNYAVADQVHGLSFNDRAGMYLYDVWVDG
jgi:peptide/nickel transport system substrate-binding protein